MLLNRSLKKKVNTKLLIQQPQIGFGYCLVEFICLYNVIGKRVFIAHFVEFHTGFSCKSKLTSLS